MKKAEEEVQKKGEVRVLSNLRLQNTGSSPMSREQL